MLSVEQAIEKLNGLVSSVSDTEKIALADSVGRVLAEPVRSKTDLPPFDSSAMDGYAVGSGDGSRYTVIGESRAGWPFDRRVAEGQAVRIFTGAALPNGADAVVLQENAVRLGEEIVVCRLPDHGENIRKIGDDVEAGAILANAGEQVDPILGSWFAACGVTDLGVYRQVRAGVFSTGDELQDPTDPLGPGQIYDSNRVALVNLVCGPAVSVLDLGRLPDDRASIEKALTAGSRSCDLMITSGGVSVGDTDHVRSAIEKIGVIEFWRVALKPGKPLAIATINNSILFGLPGNPVSSIITFLLFVAPAIQIMTGGSAGAPLRLKATLSSLVRHTPGRREYQRGRFQDKPDGGFSVVSTGPQGSNRLSSFKGANCLIEVPESASDLEAGAEIWILPLRNDRKGFA